MEPDAAMGRGAPEILDLIGPVNGVAAREENRIRHRRAIVDGGTMVTDKRGGLEGSGRRAIARPRGRDRPVVAQRANDKDRHALARQVDLRDDFSLSDARKRKDEADEDGQEHGPPHVAVPPVRAPRSSWMSEAQCSRSRANGLFKVLIPEE